MHINNNQHVDLASIQGWEISPHQIDEVIQILRLLLEFILHGVFVSFSYFPEDILHSPSPPNGCTHYSHHTDILLDPNYAFSVGIVVNILLGHLLQCYLHLLIHFGHPDLDSSLWFLGLSQLELLILIGLHTLYHLITGNLEFLTVIE